MSAKVFALVLLFQSFDQIFCHNRNRPNIVIVMSDAFVSLTFIQASLPLMN